MTDSIPICCSTSTAVAIALIRDCALAPSGMFTPSTPASFKSRIESRVFLASTPLGGRTSTDVTNSPCAIFAPHLERCSGGTTLISVGVMCSTCAGAEVEMLRCARGDAARTASAINLMCDGVVPQHPPMNFAPACMNLLANFDMYSGEHM